MGKNNDEDERGREDDNVHRGDAKALHIRRVVRCTEHPGPGGQHLALLLCVSAAHSRGGDGAIGMESGNSKMEKWNEEISKERRE